MSYLQCIEKIKNRSRIPSSKGREATAVDLTALRLPRRKAESKNKLYDIEIVAENGPEVKVHYVGYASEYDEWKPRAEIVHTKPDFGSGCSELEYSPLTELACCINKRLLPSHNDDPDVRIQVSLDAGTFQVLKERGIPRAGRGRGGSDVYTITQYSDFNDILGDNWHFQVVNEAGDFSYAILESIAFHYCTAGHC